MGSARLVVDGMNVIGSRPDGWWRDREGAARRLAAGLACLARPEKGPTPGPDERGDEQFVVVFDGRPVPGLPEGEHAGVRVCYARRPGRDGADDRIVEELEDHPALPTTVVTADRRLQERARGAGAAILPPSVLLARLDAANRTRPTRSRPGPARRSG